MLEEHVIMPNQTSRLNGEVTSFLDALNHPLRNEIEALRHCLLAANGDLSENIKWNGPNYTFGGADCITMRIQPPTTKQIQVIFHCGAKVKVQPKEKLLSEDYGILDWKANDRAIASFKNIKEVQVGAADLAKVVQAWLEVPQ